MATPSFARGARQFSAPLGDSDEAAARPKKKGGRLVRNAKGNAAKKVEREALSKAEIRANTPLTKSQIQHLRTLGQAMAPLVQLGKDGISEGLIKGLLAQLVAHELVKIKMLPEAPEDRHDAAPALAAAAGATLVQLVGRTILLFRPNPKKPKVELPK